ncbi:MAG: hypothetical protein QOC92_2889 [Acidimicrobiaceae bacterium]|jgi:HAD superfamily hydrolase (TIGR01509 family)
MSISAVLFDVDGTLVDSNYHHTLAWSRALRAHGHRVPLFVVHRLIGMGGSELLEKLIGHPDATVEESWRRHFDELLPEVFAFDGAGALLHAVHERGATIVLATSSPQDLLSEMRARIDADEAIHDVVTSGDADRAKPHPDIFEIALEKSGALRDDAVVVGDSVWDVGAATKARLQCIALESGGYSRGELEAAGAHVVYRDPNDLRARLAEWMR